MNLGRTTWLLLLVASPLAACGESEPEAPNETSQAQQSAARHACAAERLSADAADDLQTLESTRGAGGGAASAATTFARAYAQHAQLRAAAYAQTDSALNHSTSAQDSTARLQAAEQFEIRNPQPGSLEANVMTSFDEKLSAVLADADHPCNWRHEVEG